MGILEIVGIMVALIIVLSVVGWLIGVSRSKSSKTIIPDADISVTALVVYDPGLTGGTRTAPTAFITFINSAYNNWSSS